MSLLFVDGFNHYITDSVNKKWDVVFGSPTTEMFAPYQDIYYGKHIGHSFRQGLVFLEETNGSYIGKTLPTNYSSLIVGLALMFYSQDGINDFTPSADTYELLSFCEGGTLANGGTNTQFTVCRNSSGFLEVYYNNANTGTLLGTSTYSLPVFNTSYIEVKTVFDTAVGSVTINVDDVEWLSIDNIDNCFTGNTYCNHVSIGSNLNSNPTTTTSLTIDEVYILDPTAGDLNDFLGTSRLDISIPIQDGTYFDFTNSSANPNTDTVNKLDIAANTEYLTGSVANDTVSFLMSKTWRANIIQPIYGVQINILAEKTSGSSVLEITPLVIIGGIDYYGDLTEVSTGQHVYSYIWRLNPDISDPWDWASIVASEFGVVLSTVTSPNTVLVKQIMVEVIQSYPLRYGGYGEAILSADLTWS